MRHGFAAAFCYGPAAPWSFPWQGTADKKETRQEGILK